MSTIGFIHSDLRARQLRRSLRTDALTGLGNRLALQEEFERAGRRGSVLLLDLDGFKGINDTFGHRCGDQVLVEIARRLRGHQRPGQLAVRLSGDEFAFWASDISDPTELQRRIAVSLAEPIAVDGRMLTATASIGTATTTRAESLEDLMEIADQAMYRAKRERPHLTRVHTAHQSPRRREVA